MKKRLLATAALVLATAITVIIAYSRGIDPPTVNVIGAFLAVAATAAVLFGFKVADGIFYNGLIFVFLASPLGSVLDFYRTVDSYDKVVHLISGVVLAAFGMMLFRRLLLGAVKKRSGIGDERELLSLFSAPLCFGAFVFSGAAAGFWEIFEFVADKLAGGGMQRGMVDTVTDMIAGFLGALVYTAAAAVIEKMKSKKS